MSASATNSTQLDTADVDSFQKHLKNSDRILALCGAGLSAASGLPTFRGAGGLWRSYDATSLATPDAFSRDPGLVWQFYSYRRHMALGCKPNPAHYALAELARRKRGFVTLTQNVDGLSERVGHPSSRLHLLHGSLFDIRCTSFFCNFNEQRNFTDPLVPALAIPKKIPNPGPLGRPDPGLASATSSEDPNKPAFPKPEEPEEADISDDRVELPELDMEDIPKCPRCGDGILRPGVVWFGESLPAETLEKVDAFLAEPKKIDLILVIGTSSKVYPAAGYVEEARQRGARVAVVNMDRADIPGGQHGLDKGDWFFGGDAGVILPKLLYSEIGDISGKMEEI